MKRTSIADNFDLSWRKVPNGCWEFMRCRHPFGYGQLRFGGKTVRAHRHAWELYVGPIPAGLDVLHHCDNPSCVNPKHLYLGTDLENARDRESRGRGGAGKRNNGVTKIDRVTADTIRRKYRDGGVTYTEIGDLFGLKKSQVGNIILRRCWKQ